MIFRRLTIYVLAALLAMLPALGVSADTSAAATSRVAIITSLSGTVTVKKSGGSKEFRAFARMSLNEGDILQTAANGKAVLQFANGTSEDDKMTVSANTTLTFSKLSDRGGTRTKVSMFNGKVWVDVKSITNKNDEFTLETPTAIMGVRGTHFYIDVDSQSGDSRLFVASGIVQGQSRGGQETAVLPGNEALATGSDEDDSEIVTSPVNLDALFELSTPEIIEAILEASAEIAQENDSMMDRYKDEAESTDSMDEDDIARFRNNVESLVGAIVQGAANSDKIPPERVNEIVADAQARTGFEIDLNKSEIVLTDDEKRRQEELLQKLEESRQRAEQRRQANQIDNELQDQLAELNRQRMEASRDAAEERRRQAAQTYEDQLSAEERARYEQDRNALDAPAPASTPPPASVDGGPSGGSGGDVDPSVLDARLQDLQISYVSEYNGIYPYEFDPDIDVYEIELASYYDLFEVFVLHPEPLQPGAAVNSVAINGESVAFLDTLNGFPIVGIPGAVVDLEVVAPNGAATKTYQLHFTRSHTFTSDIDSFTVRAGDREVDYVMLSDSYAEREYGVFVSESVSNIEIQFDMQPDKMTLITASKDGDVVAQTDESGVMQLPIPSDGYSTYHIEYTTVASYNQSFKITVLNGAQTPNWDFEALFEINDATLEVVASDRFEVTLPRTEYNLKFTIHHAGSVILYNVTDHSYTVDYKDDPFDYISVYPDKEKNEYIFYVIDESGHYVKDYYLTVHYPVELNGLTSWRVGVGENEQDIKYFTEYYGQYEFYALFPAEQTSADLYLNWNQEAEAYTIIACQLDYDEYDFLDIICADEYQSDAISDATTLVQVPLQPGINTYVLQINGSGGVLIDQYMIHLVRGDSFSAEYLFVEQYVIDDQTDWQDETVTRSVYQTSPYTFTVFGDGSMSNDYKVDFFWLFESYDSFNEIVPLDTEHEVRFTEAFFILKDIGPYPADTAAQYEFIMFIWDPFRLRITEYTLTLIVDPDTVPSI